MKLKREFKFRCPACGQHIAGEEGYIGRRISCPACKAQIRVPKPGAEKPKGDLPSAQLVGSSHAESVTGPGKAGQRSPGRPMLTSKSTGKLQPKSKPASQLRATGAVSSTSRPLSKSEASKATSLPEKKATPPLKISPPDKSALKLADKATSEAPPLQVPSASKPAAPLAAPPAQAAPIRVAIPAGTVPPPDQRKHHFLCPVCDAELAAPSAGIGDGDTLPKAALIRESKVARSATETGQASAVQEPSKQAASARPGGDMKPRMDYILTGERPVPLKPE